MARQAGRLGFEPICDLIDLTARRSAPDPRTVVRVLSRPSDGATLAVYHFKPALRWRLLMLLGRFGPARIYELETELSDGGLVQTTTSSERSQVPAPGSLQRRYLDARKLSVDQVIREHSRAVAEYIDSHPGAEPVPQLSFEDVVAAQNRAAAARREHLKSIGWVTRDFLLRSGRASEKLADRLLEEIQRILAEEEAAGVQLGGSPPEEDPAGDLAADPSRREQFLGALAERGIMVLTTVPDESGEFRWLDYDDKGTHIFPLFTSQARADEFARARLQEAPPPGDYAAFSILTLEPSFLWSQDLSSYELRVNPASAATTVLTRADVRQLHELVETGGRTSGS